jgi:hypothetical protein
MRISDDRYSRERLCLQVALRFLEHEARTQTIRAWTGLSDDRIRKLLVFASSDSKLTGRSMSRCVTSCCGYGRPALLSTSTKWLN